MTPQQKKRVLLYGVLFSAVHFAAVGFCHAIPPLLMRPEDMIDSPNAKPSWPRYPLGEAAERVGDILRVPFDWIWEGRLSHSAPEAIGFLLLVLTSCLWGFGLVFVFRFLFTHLRPRHANAA
jgi:hypothetical protein